MSTHLRSFNEIITERSGSGMVGMGDRRSRMALLSAGERGKWDVDCDKQIEKAVTAPNCVLKGSWGKGGSRGIRKKLKSEYAAYLESKYRRNDGSSI